MPYFLWFTAPQNWPADSIPSTASHRVWFDIFSFASGIIASSHCPSLSAACSTVPVMLLTHHTTSRDAQKGQLQEKLPVDHNKAHPYKTHSIIKQTAGEALNNFFPYCSNSCSPHVSHSYKVLGMRFRKQWKKGSSPKAREKKKKVAFLKINLLKKAN